MQRAPMAAVVTAVVGIALVNVAPAVADPAPSVEDAVAQARSASSCGPLAHSPELERAAEIINRSTLTYLDHSGDNIPADDPHPVDILEGLGIAAKNVHSLQGAGLVESDAIKGLLLQGFKSIPDCSFTEIGASRLYEPQSGYYLTVALLVEK